MRGILLHFYNEKREKRKKKREKKRIFVSDHYTQKTLKLKLRCYEKKKNALGECLKEKAKKEKKYKDR